MIAASLRRLAALSVVLPCFALAGCGDPTGSVPSEAVGTYTLASVNGMAPPVRISDTPTQQVDIVAGTLLVRGDGSYREARESRITDSAGTRAGASFTEGTLRVSGSSVQVRERAGGRYSGSFDGTTISYTVAAGAAAAITFTYEKD